MMELPAREAKSLERHLRMERRIRRFPRLVRAAVWSILLVAALHLARAGFAAAEAARLARGPGPSMANGFMPDPEEMEGERRFLAVAVSHARLAGFWQAVSAAGIGTLAGAFFVCLFFLVRSSLRDHALVVALHGKLEAAEAAEPAGPGASGGS
jgi:hypothetical protein